METNNERFLNLYKKVEALLQRIVHGKPQDSPVWLYENLLRKSDDIEKKVRSEKYSIARQMRNILAHDDMGENDPFEVSVESIMFLEEELKILEEQKTAKEVCVPYANLLYATKNSLVTNIASMMLEKGITNVPILNQKKVIGMFNGKAFIHMMRSRKAIQITESTKMKDIKQFLYLDMNDGIRYEFVAADTRIDQLDHLFLRNKKGKTELLIVTETGDKFEPIIGVISPHDILERR